MISASVMKGLISSAQLKRISITIIYKQLYKIALALAKKTRYKNILQNKP